MLTQSLTYLQAMPEFLDLLFPFGERAVAQDFYSGGFHQRTRLPKNTPSLRVPERAWSGYDYQLCYSLKSVEKSETQPDWPWSVRHCAIHHAFDVVNVRSTWVVVKGDQLIEKRILSATSGQGPPEFLSYGTIDRAFTAALATQLIMVDWSAENWRWYISFLEDKFDGLTKEAISLDADVITYSMDMDDVLALRSRTNTEITNQTHKSQRSFPRTFRTSSQKTNTTLSLSEMQPSQTPQYRINPRSGKKQPLPPGRIIASPETTKIKGVQYDTYGQRQFNFVIYKIYMTSKRE